MGLKNKRRAAQKRGIRSEWIAALFLVFKGYRICAMRFRTKLGEVDIVARKGCLIAMIEVKARKDVETAFHSVTGNAKRRIHGAADVWISGQTDAEALSIRFDVIAIRPWRFPVHIKDAF